MRRGLRSQGNGRGYPSLRPRKLKINAASAGVHSNEVAPIAKDVPATSRRRVVRSACESCRRLKRKCDGGRPCCTNCEEHGKECLYLTNSGETRASALKRKNISLEEELETLRNLFSRIKKSSPDEAYKIIAHTQLYLDPAEALQSFSSPGENAGYARQGLEGETEKPRRAPTESGSTTLYEEAGLSCFDHLVSWASIVPKQDHTDTASGAPATASTLSSILSFPPLPLDVYTTQLESDRWTRTGWTKAHIRHLFDTILTWDQLVFCLLCKDLFFRDYDTGATQFCSSALVNAILALASRLINENDDDDILPSGWLGSKYFFTEAKALLHDIELSSSLPDIQTLGVLSLYEIRCGREAEALEFAELFLSKVTKLCYETTGKSKEEHDYITARDAAYCGAVSLIRVLQLATGHVFYLPKLAVSDDLQRIKQVPYTTTSQQGSSLATDLYNLQPSHTQHIATKIFQLTEWVYKLILATQSSADNKAIAVSAIYVQCLDWYNSFLGGVKPNGNRTPFVLFIHMFYHFNLLCLFRSLMGQAVDEPNVQPQQMCIQAVQSILALAQSYDDLFTLRRVPGLMPYFLCAAGLFSIAIETGSTAMDRVHLRVGQNASQLHKSGSREYKSADDKGSTSRSPAYVKMSASAHARLLLAKIGSNHAIAKLAETLLQEAIQDKAFPF